MREGGQLLEAEHRPRALDGVQSAKDASHQFHVGAVLVQLQQRRFKIDKDLARFFAEALFELVGVGCWMVDTWPVAISLLNEEPEIFQSPLFQSVRDRFRHCPVERESHARASCLALRRPEQLDRRYVEIGICMERNDALPCPP